MGAKAHTSLVSEAPYDYEEIIRNVNESMKAVKQHVYNLSSLGTRETGYPGNLEAAEYIRNAFVNYGLENVSYHEFEAANSVDHGANITLLSSGEIRRIYPLRVNLVVPSTTPPSGIEGRLIYVGAGYLTDFDGLDVKGSIVIMDWNTGFRWLYAAKLRAKAVIFIPPPFVEGWQPGPETATAPFNFPRFYVEKDVADLLLENLGEQVKLMANTRWERTKGINVLGFLKGTKWNEIIVLSAYYDTGPQVLSLGPGAQEATGIAALLELAKYFRDHRPDYNLLFVAFGGHHQGVLGSMRFCDDYFWPALDEAKWAIGRRVRLWIQLDFPTGSNQFFETWWGRQSTTGSWQGQHTQQSAISGYFRAVQAEINSRRPFGKTFKGIFERLDCMMTAQVFPLTTGDVYDIEPISQGVSYPAFVFTTGNDTNPYKGKPWDTFSRVNFDNLQDLLGLTYCLLVNALNMEHTTLENFYSKYPPFQSAHGAEEPQFWLLVSGQVAEWVDELAWYRPVPNAIVRVSYAASGMGAVPYTATPRINTIFVMADKNGYFKTSIIWAAGGTLVYEVAAWVIDNSTGNILYAPDWGIHGYSAIGGTELMSEQLGALRNLGIVSVFKAASVVLFDRVEPTALALARLFETPGSVVSMFVDAMKISTHTVVPARSYWLTSQPDLSVEVLAFPPDVPVEFMTRSARAVRYSVALLTNSSDGNPQGQGYVVEAGEQLIIPFTTLEYARGLFYVNEDRFKTLININPAEAEGSAYRKQLEARALIGKADEALKNYEYSQAHRYSVEAWSRCASAYMYTRTKLEDAALTVPYFAMLLIPFILLGEKLLLNIQGNKKAIAYAFLFIIVLGALYILHPGFSIAASPLMILIGLSLLILTFPIVTIIYGRTMEYIEALSIRIFGRHAEEVSKVSLFLFGTMLGIENMRKRKLRVALTLVTLVITVMALVNFASISAETVPSQVEVPAGNPIYTGVHIRLYKWGGGFPEVGLPVLDFLKASYGDRAIIAPRAWFYNYLCSSVEVEDITGYRVEYKGKQILAYALWGLTLQEKEFTNPEKFLIAGRWFEPTDVRTCIITNVQARQLGITDEELPVSIFLGDGLGEFRVIGIIDKSYGEVPDLDGEITTPLKLNLILAPNPYDIHERIELMVIVRYEELLTLGNRHVEGTTYYITWSYPQTASVSLKFEDASIVPEVARNISRILSDLHVYYNAGKQVFLTSRATTFTFLGVETQIVPFAIVALSIFNIVIGSIYERRREIATYGALGLSPMHVSSMFLSELIVYALVGSVIGYIAAMLSTRFLGTLMPGVIVLNYSSGWVVMALSMCILTVLVSSIYPMWMASKLVTPSLRRVWEIPTTPVGDLWEIPLPFFTTTSEEANGAMAYLEEFLRPHQIPRAPDFSVQNLKAEVGIMEGAPYKLLSMDAYLTPYEAGIHQSTKIYMNYSRLRWEMRVIIERKGGSIPDWQKYNWRFISYIRGQMLMWRTLKPDEREQYLDMGKKIFGEQSVPKESPS